MGNLFNIIMCKGEGKGGPPTLGDRRYFEGYLDSNEHQRVKKKCVRLIALQRKIQNERDDLLKKNEEHTEIIKNLEGLMQTKKNEIEERLQELSARNEELSTMKNDLEKLIEGKDQEKSSLKLKLDEFVTLQIPKLKVKISKLGSERDDLIAENDSLDGEISILETENDAMKKLLRQINERQKAMSTHSTRLTITCDSPRSSSRNN